MKYVLTLWGDENARESWSPEKLAGEVRRWEQIGAEMSAAGALLAGEGLEPTRTATTLIVTDEGPRLTDGPFAETKEQLGGFYLLDCADLDEAIGWAKRIPLDPPSSIEIRPVMDHEAHGRVGNEAAGVAEAS
jgi:hypothetical protein